MTTSRFEAFCQRLCACLGLACPDLHQGQAPNPAMTVMLDGTELGFMAAGKGDADAAILIVELGPLASGHELQQCRMLLEANFLMMGRSVPVFALHPASQRVFVHQALRIDEVDPAQVEPMARELAAVVGRWQDGEFAAGDGPRADGLAPAFAQFAMA